MRKILEFIDKIDDELCSAKDYAEAYVQFKVEGNQIWSMKFKSMSEDNLAHASTIHELAILNLDKIKAACNMPTAMQEIWDKAHSKYVDQVAWIKQMLEM